MFISLMTEQTETTEIKMNMRNIHVITARAVPEPVRNLSVTPPHPIPV